MLVDLAGNDGLLLVAAGHAARRCDRALARAHVVLLDQALSVGADVLAAQEAGLVGEFGFKIALEHHIVLKRIVEHEAVLVPVLRDMAHAHETALPDGRVGNILALKRDFAAHGRLQTGQGVDKLRLAVAVDTGDADDLARADTERHVFDGVVLMDLGGDRQVLDGQDLAARLERAFFHVEADVSADHHGRQLLRRGIRGFDRADALALAQDGDAVGDLHDLVQLVGNEEDALALGREILHDLHQLLDLLRRQNGRRLVEDQDLVVAVEHFENFGALLHTDGDILDDRVGIDVQTVFLGQIENLFARVLLLQKAHLVRLNAEDDVVEDREALDQLEVLVHHADAERVRVVRVADLNLAAVLVDLALLRLVQAEQDAHKRRFASAVFAEQGVDFTLFQPQGDVVVGDDSGETFCDVQHLNRVIRFQVLSPSFRFYGPRLRGRKPLYPVYYKPAHKSKLFCTSCLFFVKKLPPAAAEARKNRPAYAAAAVCFAFTRP